MAFMSTHHNTAFSTARRPILKSTVTEETAITLSASDIVSKYEQQMAKMAEKDKLSIDISKDDLNVVHVDDHIIVVSKPSGVLCVPDKSQNPSLNSAVFAAYGGLEGSADMSQMVVHRLGMDTSGLVVFARTLKALRHLNTQFRVRKVTRKYESLLCGKLTEGGSIDFPLMRDFEAPPYVRVSTDDMQNKLIGLDKEDLPKDLHKILAAPKPSITKYEVLGAEEIGGNDVTRVELVSLSGRTHQLNVHCAAIGHAIVNDSTYGVDGVATKNGGVEVDGVISEEAQREINAAKDGGMCVHLKELTFQHPESGEMMTFKSEAPF